MRLSVNKLGNERERAETGEVRQMEELYRRAIAGAGAVPYASDFKTRSYLFMGEGIEQLIGYSAHEVTGELWPRIIQESVMLGDAAGLTKEEAAQRVLTGQLRNWRCDMRILTRSGQSRWISDASVQSFDDADRPVGAVGILQDITERKRAEDERNRLFNLSADMLCVAGFDGCLKQVNPAWSSCLGWTAEELTSRPMIDYILPEDHEATRQMREQIHQGKTVRGFENRYRCKDGSYRWLSWSVHPWIVSRQVFAVARDVTQQKLAEEAVQRSEREQRQLAGQLEIERARLVAAQHVAKLCSWQVDLMTMEVFWSEEAFEIYELSPESFHPAIETIRQRVHPQDQAALDDAFYRSIEKPGTYVNEHRLLFPTGRIKFLEARWQIIHNDENKPVRAVGTCQDITERKQGEQQIKETEERYRALFDRSLDAVYVHDLEGRFLDANPAALQLLGYTRDDLSNADFSSLVTNQEDIARAFASIESQLTSDVPEGISRYQLRRKDGSRIWVELVSSLVFSNGKPVAVQGIARDITERKQAEEKLAQQAALLNEAREAIFVIDLEDRITFWNHGAERICGWKSAEALGEKSRELFALQKIPFEEATRLLFQNGHWQGDLKKKTKSGRDLTMETRWTLVRDEHGQPKSILAINTDITEKKKLEAQFLRTQRMESIGTLAGGIAHDLNNVLAPILMSVEILKMSFVDEESQNLLHTVQNSAQRGADLVKQVLSFARGVEGQRVIVNPLHLMRELLKVMRDTFPKTISVRFTPVPDLWTINGDATQLHQVFLNLCVNARDAMPSGGNLIVTMENVVLDETYAAMNPDSAPGAYVHVKVSDTGSGIPQDIQDKIFEPFFTTKEFGKGTGLGLSTTLAIVKSHGGFINLYSEIGKGATFQVYLPANTTEVAADKSAVEQTRLPRGNGEIVLVVDDEESIRHIAQRTLERFGYKVMLASNGAEGVSLYAQNRDRIAVVLTDMAMPIMDGPALIMALKAMNPKVRIVGSSGLTTSGGVTRAVGTGIEHFVPKPYTAEAMLTVLKKVLDENSPPA